MHKFNTLGKIHVSGFIYGCFYFPGCISVEMSTLFHNMLYICVYMDDLLIIINYTFKNHMDILYEILKLIGKIRNSGQHS